MSDKFKVYSEDGGMYPDDFETKKAAMDEAQEYIDLYIQGKDGLSENDTVYVLKVIAESYLVEIDSKKATEARGEEWDYDNDTSIFDVVLNDLDSAQPAIEEMRACIDELIAAIDSSSFCSECSEEFGTSACSECPWCRAKNKAFSLIGRKG